MQKELFSVIRSLLFVSLVFTMRALEALPFTASQRELVSQKVLSSPQKEICSLFFSHGIVLRDVPVAKTPEQKKKGLSHRKDPGVGMLFVWDVPQKLGFWMKDTYFPLSIGYIGEKGVLFQILHMEPRTKTPHFSSRPALYALELPQGRFATYGLNEGDHLLKKTCKLA